MEKRRESDLFEPVKQWLEERGWDVYAEVMPRAGGGRADVVAVRGAATLVVELKNTLSLDVIGQAVRWKQAAHYVYVAVPKSRHRSDYGAQLLRREGVGMLEVDQKRAFAVASRTAPARFQRPWDDALRSALKPQHKELPGGHAGGGYVTDYRLTMDSVRQFLRYYVYENEGWATVAEILEHCETHYASPRQSVAKALLSFESDWCEARKAGRVWQFRYRRHQG